MKKTLVFMLSVIIALSLMGCAANDAAGKTGSPENSGGEECAGPADNNAGKDQNMGLSVVDIETIAAMLERGHWSDEGTTDCLYDYMFDWNGHKVYYHSDCGTFKDPASGEHGQSLRLTDGDKRCVNMIVRKLAKGEDGAQVLSEPPALTVACGGVNTKACRGAVSWMYWREDGTGMGLQADSLHPLQMREYMEPLPLPSGADPLRAYLQFDTVPNQVRVRCWSDQYWGQYDAEAEVVEVMKLMFDHAGEEIDPMFFVELKEGGYVYEVAAEWKHSGKYEGTAYYSFCTVKK